MWLQRGAVAKLAMLTDKRSHVEMSFITPASRLA
jgi:hypothetical protein